ncbi:hypothetical protein JRO89_XS02G0237100 [Xanthoceras sorbifolium]|uniref:Coiled-coil domain-containing protein 47 n=1 Tax=Xanthoceras sorbifolium TaxID=99658 RepID=A0ABQ8IH23_9ROSI|nr:hypothetical protein JRO89_XS02G0237100 [Xanthoceras sorbifolium]
MKTTSNNRPTSLLLILLCLLILSLSLSSVLADSHFEGFDAEDDVVEDESLDLDSLRKLTDLPLTQSDSSPPITKTTHLTSSDPQSDSDPKPNPTPENPKLSSPTTSFDYWDEDEFEGVPVLHPPPDTQETTENAAPNQNLDPKTTKESKTVPVPKKPSSYLVEIVSVTFLIMFLINYFTGKRENENLALAWAAKFATKDSIFEKNFSLLGVGEGDDSPLLLKEGQNVFKFYASGRRYCSGLLATMELKSRHDLISRLYNLVVPCKDEITFEVYMNEDAMDHVVFAMAKKKAAKGMQKELQDLNRFAGLVAAPTGGRKWVADELGVISESKEVAGDMITDTVLEQLDPPVSLPDPLPRLPTCLIRGRGIGRDLFTFCDLRFGMESDGSVGDGHGVFGEKAFEKFGRGFISMHLSDQHPGIQKKVLIFKFALPDANNMTDMTRLVALVPYYIDLIGRYKLSPQARSKTDAARQKAAQEAYKELQNARQEALQRKKAERKKMMEETEAKLSAESIRKREAKERTRQMKKAMPRVKMTRGN